MRSSPSFMDASDGHHACSSSGASALRHVPSAGQPASPGFLPRGCATRGVGIDKSGTRPALTWRPKPSGGSRRRTRGDRRDPCGLLHASHQRLGRRARRGARPRRQNHVQRHDEEQRGQGQWRIAGCGRERTILNRAIRTHYRDEREQADSTKNPDIRCQPQNRGWDRGRAVAVPPGTGRAGGRRGRVR